MPDKKDLLKKAKKHKQTNSSGGRTNKLLNQARSASEHMNANRGNYKEKDFNDMKFMLEALEEAKGNKAAPFVGAEGSGSVRGRIGNYDHLDGAGVKHRYDKVPPQGLVDALVGGRGGGPSSAPPRPSREWSAQEMRDLINSLEAKHGKDSVSVTRDRPAPAPEQRMAVSPYPVNQEGLRGRPGPQSDLARFGTQESYGPPGLKADLPGMLRGAPRGGHAAGGALYGAGQEISQGVQAGPGSVRMRKDPGLEFSFGKGTVEPLEQPQAAGLSDEEQAQLDYLQWKARGMK